MLCIAISTKVTSVSVSDELNYLSINIIIYSCITKHSLSMELITRDILMSLLPIPLIM